MALRAPEYIGLPGAALDGVIEAKDGYPTSYPTEMHDQILKTMPIALITPCLPRYDIGLELYSVFPAWGEYVGYLSSQGVNLSGAGPSLKVVYNNVSPMGENYTSSFSQSSLVAGLESVTSEGFQDLMFMTGQSAKENVVDLSEQEGILGAIGKAAKAGMDKVGTAADNIQNQKMRKMAQSAVKIMEKPDHKIDFPQMWRSSSYSASYTMNVRLYNPSPANNNWYGSLIVASLGAIMGLTLPTSEDDELYKWPFICKFEVPGLVRMDAAYISNLSVVKGGDANDLSWNQKWYRSNLIDLQLTISPLYNVMVMSKEDKGSQRPTLKKEMEQMMTGSSSLGAVMSSTAPLGNDENNKSRLNNRVIDSKDDAVAKALGL